MAICGSYMVHETHESVGSARHGADRWCRSSTWRLRLRLVWLFWNPQSQLSAELGTAMRHGFLQDEWLLCWRRADIGTFGVSRLLTFEAGSLWYRRHWVNPDLKLKHPCTRTGYLCLFDLFLSGDACGSQERLVQLWSWLLEVPSPPPGCSLHLHADHDLAPIVRPAAPHQVWRIPWNSAKIALFLSSLFTGLIDCPAKPSYNVIL